MCCMVVILLIVMVRGELCELGSSWPFSNSA
jgi:hypothetical protein